MLAAGGLRSGRPPLQPRVQVEERGLQRGDFSLWLRPARRADAGEYRAAVHLRDRSVACRLRLRVGQASSRWGWAAGSGAGAGRRGPRRPGGRKGRRGGVCAYQDAPWAPPESPQKGSGRGWGAEWKGPPEKYVCGERTLWRDCLTPGAPLLHPHWECQGGGGEAPLGWGAGCRARVTHFRHL